MNYTKKLIIRITIAIVLLILPINIFYVIFLKPTLYLSALPFLKLSPLIATDSILINNAILMFNPACIATSAYYLLTILTLLTKNINLKKSIILIISGSLLIFIANIIRIDLLIFFFLKNNINLFQSLHFLFWKILSSLYVVLIWILLTKKLKIKQIPAVSDVKYLLSKTKIFK